MRTENEWELEPAKGIEPPTYGLRILLGVLILNKINNLARQNPNKSGKICNPRATTLRHKVESLDQTKTKREANDPFPVESALSGSEPTNGRGSNRAKLR